jgi:peptidoglycan hydrolase-like protein with peptidoglycan-binding domain
MAMNLEEMQAIEAEMRKRGIDPNAYGGDAKNQRSVFEPAQEKTFTQNVRDFGESLVKGGAKGVLDIVGGWGNLYDYLKKKQDPSAFSTQGMVKGVKELSGVDLNTIPGFRGAYEFGAAAAPAAALTAAGLPGITGRVGMGAAAIEAPVAGATGVAASTIAPDSPAAQFALQASPYAIASGLRAGRSQLLKPEGMRTPADTGVLDVGRLTPGQFTGNRQQLAREERVRAAPESGDLPRQFDIQQASDVRNYLTGLFNRAGDMNVDPVALTNQVWSSFNNFGSALSNQLKSQAKRDFTAAKNAGGLVDTTPVLQMVDQQLAQLGPETPQNSAFISALRKIREEFVEPGQPAQTIQSTVLGPSGQPATTTVVPAVPDKARNIDIDRLQKNISAWGEAAFKGAGSLADVGGSDMFAGVAQGQVKNFARQVLRAYKDALDLAIDQGVPGADRLKTARDNFAKNIDKIEEFANYPITKTFDVERVTDLVPEDVAMKLATLPKSQQAIVFSTLGQQASDVANQVRGILFQDVLNKADIKGAAANTPTFNIQAALKGIQSGDFNFLFPTAADKADAIKAMSFMQKALQSEGRAGGPSMMSGGEAYATTRALGGTAQSGNLVKILTDSIRGLADYVASPKALSEVFFDPNINNALKEAQRKKPKAEVIQRGIEAVGKYTGAMALRAGPQISPETPEDQSMQQLPTTSPVEPGPSLDEIKQELQKRGINVSSMSPSIVRQIMGEFANV